MKRSALPFLPVFVTVLLLWLALTWLGLYLARSTDSPRELVVETTDALPETFSPRGLALLQLNGCFACHGSMGSGGVPNPNYARITVPPLNNMGEKLGLQDSSEVVVFRKILEAGKDPLEIESVEGISRWGVVQTKYKAVRHIVFSGSKPAKADPDGAEPPLVMASWTDKIDQRDLHSILVWALEQQKWEDEDEDW